MTNIRAALGRLWDANGHARMLQCGGRWEPWGRVRALTEQIDKELAAEGCGEGGRVAVVLSNRRSPSPHSSPSSVPDGPW